MSGSTAKPRRSSHRRRGGAAGVTIKQVAREAGVSVATVSRVLNETGPVAETTRGRIREVTERLRYVPHGAARSLITNTTNTIGVLLPDIYGEFFSEIIRGFDLATRRNGYHLLVSGSHGDRAEIEALLRATRGRVDGLVVMSPNVDVDALHANLKETVPTVMVNCSRGSSSYDSIAIDNHGGAIAMVRHLQALGHRRIAFIKGPPDNYDARERLRGYRDAVNLLPSPGAAGPELEGDFTEEAGFHAAERLLAIEPRPTAVFAANDAMAIGALSALRRAGVHVPDAIALAGFDDIPIGRFTSPPLSSVGVSITDLGARAIERLLQGIEKQNGYRRRHEILPTHLVVRESCGAHTCTAEPTGPGIRPAAEQAQKPRANARQHTPQRAVSANEPTTKEAQFSKGGRSNAKSG